MLRLMTRLTREQARLWWQKWRWYEQNSLPWNRARIHSAFAKRSAYCRWPIHGNVLEAITDGRLQLGPQVHTEPNVWITVGPDARAQSGEGTFLNPGVMVGAVDRVELGAHCMFAKWIFTPEGNRLFGYLQRPLPCCGFAPKGPTIIGNNVWAGANVVITSGVTIGERCVIGANSVVTGDLPPFSIAAGAPAKVIRTIEYG